MIPIFIGYDPKELLAYHVLAHSIIRRATSPIAIVPLALSHLEGEYDRPRGPEATEFSYTRFLVPYLCGYEGRAIYMDCDMLALADITEMHGYAAENPDPAVLVCQHDYVPKTAIKMDGQTQTAYPRKNWSSFMVFNNPKCRALTPAYVDQAPGADLHRFAWLQDEQIGALPIDWNWLVGEYDVNPQARILHYTLGGPWFPEYRDCDHAEDWYNEYEHLRL